MAEEDEKKLPLNLTEPGMNYWTATDQVLAKNGGKGPRCPDCGGEMFPEDDHGRFTCMCRIMGRGKRSPHQ
jgi:hypothetical protein